MFGDDQTFLANRLIFRVSIDFYIKFELTIQRFYHVCIHELKAIKGRFKDKHKRRLFHRCAVANQEPNQPTRRRIR